MFACHYHPRRFLLNNFESDLNCSCEFPINFTDCLQHEGNNKNVKNRDAIFGEYWHGDAEVFLSPCNILDGPPRDICDKNFTLDDKGVLDKPVTWGVRMVTNLGILMILRNRLT